MKWTNKAWLPVSLTAAFLLAACGDEETTTKSKASNTAEEAASEQAVTEQKEIDATVDEATLTDGSAIYKHMYDTYEATDEMAQAALAKPIEGEQHEINGLAANASAIWSAYYEELHTTTLQYVDEETAIELNAKAANWDTDFAAYSAAREEQADGIYHYGAGPTFEYTMYFVEFTKQSCEELLDTLYDSTL